MESGITRRPIRARETRWAVAIARRLVKSGLKPNEISVLSVFFAAAASFCLFTVPLLEKDSLRVCLYLGAACCIPLRLLCNMFDGMVAVEGGRKTRLGDLYNELPDRVSDVLVLVGAGCSTSARGGVLLGWICAVLAVLIAYIRTLGGVTGAVQPFCGPMAKQQRMATVVAGSILAAGEIILGQPPLIMTVALGVICAGSVVTCARRVRIIARDLTSK